MKIWIIPSCNVLRPKALLSQRKTKALNFWPRGSPEQWLLMGGRRYEVSSSYWTTLGNLNLAQEFSWAKEENLSKSWFPHIENSGNIVFYFLWSSGRPRRLECTVQGSREERSSESSFWSFPKSWEMCAFEKSTKFRERKTKRERWENVLDPTGLGIVPIFTNWKGTHVALNGVIIRMLCYSEAKFLWTN